MAGRLAEVEARRTSIEELGTVTDAMRSLAAARMQQALATLDATHAYAEVVASALARAVSLPGQAPVRELARARGRTALIVFAPEHGFVGALAERLVEAALAGPRERTLWMVGSRGAALLAERGLQPARSVPMASRTEGVAAVARRVAESLYRAAAEDWLGPVELVHGRTAAGAVPQIVRESLLPLDLSHFRGQAAAPPPLTNLPPDRLVPCLVDEYVLAVLVRVAMESFAAENAARLSVMMAARQNIGAVLDELTGTVRRLRQDEITSELIELTTGAEALTGGRGSDAWP